jgi:TolB-like protein
VFLSYASQDAEAARRICESLRAAGVEVWFDQSELRGGDAWDQKIRRQIKECSLFVPIISAQTQARLEGYFRLEWKLAAQRTHAMADAKPFVMPVVPDDTSDSHAYVPEEFRAVQWSRLNQGEAGVAFCERVSALLEANATPRSSTAAPFSRPETTARQPAGKSSPADKSIAVLAFANLSNDPENEHFSDGISEELLNVLAHVPSLRVTARTSSFSFKGRNVPVPEIAQRLGVGYIVEGSVRRAGSRVRITAQLVDAVEDAHLWSETFDRELKDIFALQDEIAGLIAQNLQLKLGRRLEARKVELEASTLTGNGGGTQVVQC